MSQWWHEATFPTVFQRSIAAKGGGKAQPGLTQDPVSITGEVSDSDLQTPASPSSGTSSVVSDLSPSPSLFGIDCILDIKSEQKEVQAIF